MLPILKTITPNEAYVIMEQYNNDHNKPTPDIRYVYNYAELYEGVLSYKTCDGRWNIYDHLWRHYLETGFPDLAIKQPVMTLSVALRYLHKCGVDPNYKLREFRKDVTKLGMVIKENKDGVIRNHRITRSNCNKFLKIWNGNG